MTSKHMKRYSISLLEIQFSSVQALSRVWLFATPWITARQASLSITNSWSSLRLTSIESVMPSSHLILCRPLHLLPPIPPSIRVFSNESTLPMRRPKYWSFNFIVIPSKEHPGLISFRWLRKCKWNSQWDITTYAHACSVVSDSCKPMDCSPPDSSVHRIFQARTPIWVTISFSRGSSQHRDQTCVSCTGRRILYH